MQLVVDTRVKVWSRGYVEVDTDSMEEAIALIKEGQYDRVKYVEYDYIGETEVPISTEDNDGYSTMEIMDSNYNIVYSNGRQL